MNNEPQSPRLHLQEKLLALDALRAQLLNCQQCRLALPGPASWPGRAMPIVGCSSLPWLREKKKDQKGRMFIGTAAAIGFPIAIAGAVGYLVNGLAAANLPPWSLGYIYLPALLGIAGMSILTAPLGARLAHSLPVNRLKQVFAVLLLVMRTKMLFDLWR